MKLFTKLLVSMLIIIGSFGVSIKHLTSTNIYPVFASVRQWTEKNTMDLINEKSIEYSVSSTTMLNIIKCETGNDISSTTIQSRHYKDGIREKSYGLVQIHLPSWKDITYDQATDPYFAIDFLAEKLSKGSGYLWSCWSMI